MTASADARTNRAAISTHPAPEPPVGAGGTAGTADLPRDGVPAHAARSITATARGTTFADLGPRNLGQGELLELAASVAADPALWRAEVAFDDEHRHYANIYRDEHVDVWVLCWTPVNDTGWHDHDVSSGAVAVVDGRLVEHNLAFGGPSIVTEIAAGQVYSFGPDHIHRLTGLDAGSVSIHAYSPPLVTMGQYVIDPATGLLHRTAVSYTEELGAMDAAADATQAAPA